MQIVLAVEVFKLLAAALFVFFAGQVFYYVRKSAEKSMISFELSPDSTRDEYRIMLYANISVSIGLFMYFLSDILGIQALLIAGKIITGLYTLTIAYVISRWVRRFHAN